MVWRQRFAPRTGKESPFVLPELNLADDAPTTFKPSFSVEPSDAATPSSRKPRAKGAIAAKRKGGRGAAPPSRRSKRQTGSAAGSVEEDEGGQEDGEHEDAGEEDDGKDNTADDDDGEDQSQASTPAPRSTRSAASVKGSSVTQPRPRGRPRRI